MTDEYDALPLQMRNDITEYSTKQFLVRNRLISNVLVYCNNYPNEKIAQNRFLKEYEQYPYRLHQNMVTLMDDL